MRDERYFVAVARVKFQFRNKFTATVQLQRSGGYAIIMCIVRYFMAVGRIKFQFRNKFTAAAQL